MCPSTTQHPHFAVAHCASPCGTTIVSQPQAPVIPGGPILSRSFPVLTAKSEVGAFTDYPPAYTADADEALVNTYGSYHEEPPVAFAGNTRRDDAWTLCVPVDAPTGLNNPTLLSVDYAIKYATTADAGNATVQTDVLLTTTSLPAEIVSARTPLGVYRPGVGGGVRTVDGGAALHLGRALAVKTNGGTEEWSYYLDAQTVSPAVRVRDSAAKVYVVFTVNEHSTTRTARSLDVEVSAVWQKEEVENKAKALAEKEKAEREAKEAAELAERKAREAEEKKAREEFHAWIEEERQARKAEAEARAEAKQAREEERKWREEFKIQWEADRAARAAAAAAASAAPKPKPSVEAAPDVADDNIQYHIKETMARLNMQPCPQGFEFVKVENGYRCKGGSHFVTFEQLGMKAEEKPKPSIEAAPDHADENVQHHIQETMAKLNMAPCPQGYAFVKTGTGYRCKGGSHFVSFEQLGMS